ncbi:lysozyme [Teichococcus vastitatis]|uniref:lysozyme n=1 Tax=Teichococcus vastitatis TaxID=2307076 RepID=UPI003462748F
MKTNWKGICLIKRYEGVKLTAYTCVGGVLTIGVGHTGNVKPGETITQLEAEQLLAGDLEKFEAGVAKLVTVPLNNDQFSAIVSFAFNCGLEALRTSTLLRKLNAGDLHGAADQLPRWNKSGGKVYAGLVKRRAAERALFLGLPVQMNLLSPELDEALGKVIIDIVAPSLMELLVTWLTGLLKRS